ncbi:hypothetical protein [Kitasatospora phosalacinea]|uniref:Uncharacterized protein n=1 Tax=Kitasatospora phosalacinea TaxID=2065 RepID=A0A9W6PQZ0_9ACTN|nr:hypothetical protein [Kitasatospora phosalacinea]GLW59311.1 hypothetical protein Kpho01_73210 [Kitasatospora phosalacinea]
MSHPHHDDPDDHVVVVVTDRAAQCAKEFGAEDVLEALRSELERRPRLGRPIRSVAENGHQVELYSTRIEGDKAAGRAALNVAFAYAPAPPWPPAVRIAAVIPEDLPHSGS